MIILLKGSTNKRNNEVSEKLTSDFIDNTWHS